MTVRSAAIALIALVLVVAGCGGGKKKSTTPATTAGTTSAGSTTTSGLPKFASAKNCQQLSALGAKIAQAVQASSGAGTGSLDNEANVFKALADAAPAEIRGDFQTFATAFEAYTKALAKAGFKAGQAPSAAQIAELTTAAKAFNTPKLQAAEQHLAAWGQKNCGAGK
jgi:hypothetical protein